MCRRRRFRRWRGWTADEPACPQPRGTGPSAIQRGDAMSTRMFWIAATLLLAIVVHLSYVLFAPGDTVERKLAALRGLAGVNSLKVLSAEDSRTLLGGEG